MKNYLYHVIYVIFTFVLTYFAMVFFTLKPNPLQWEEVERFFTVCAVLMLQLGHAGVKEIYQNQGN